MPPKVMVGTRFKWVIVGDVWREYRATAPDGATLLVKRWRANKQKWESSISRAKTVVVGIEDTATKAALAAEKQWELEAEG